MRLAARHRLVSRAIRMEVEERGYVVIPDALEPGLLARLLRAHDRVYAEEQSSGRLAADGSLHLLGFLARDPAFLELLDLPAILPLVAELLGWNIYVYHSHLDAHPPTPNGVPSWRWHQDGGRQNLDIETEPTRPRLSVKVAYFLTDVLGGDAGAMKVVPGSQRRNTLRRPQHLEDHHDEPDSAEPVTAPAGTAVVFDRRLWHARGDNRSGLTRKALFVGYTYRWVRPRESTNVRRAGLTPIQRQLLGESTGELGFWLPSDEDVPLRGWMEMNGMSGRGGADSR